MWRFDILLRKREVYYVLFKVTNTTGKQLVCHWVNIKAQTCWTRKDSDSLSPLHFGDLAQHERPPTCPCTDLPKIILHKTHHAVIIMVERQKKKTALGNKMRQGKKEQGSQNILAVSPDGPAESGCMLITPGNTRRGTAVGRLPGRRSDHHRSQKCGSFL